MEIISHLRSIAVIFMAAFFMAACTLVSTGSVQSPDQPTIANNVEKPTAEMIVSTGMGEAGAFTQFQQGELSIQILSPQDEEVVKTKQIEVTGKAPVETVISINDQIILVPASGDFSAPVTLEEGPNIIELVASDENGNELDIILTVVYEP